MAFEWSTVVERLFSQETAVAVAVLTLLVGLLAAYYAWKWIHRFADQAGVTEAVEGTPFERTARSFGTSTVGIVATLAAAFVYVAAIVLALQFVGLQFQLFWSRVTGYLPRLFVAAIALIVGLIVADKARLVVSERLRSVKLPEAGLLPELVKYSIFYIAALIALGQVGVDTGALLVLLAAYAFGVIFLSGLAFKDLLAAGAAGVYLLLTEPYVIGDEIEIDGKRGIVQEVDVFVTHVEGEGKEYVVPNQQVLRSGVIRFRE
jgi:small-conductance mechanosensitive channel